MFNRTIDFLSEQGFKKIRNSTVTIIGLGGVGSHAAVALIRSGIGKLNLVDFDNLTISSLNRHACANHDDIGKNKASLLKDHLLKIYPYSDINVYNDFFHLDSSIKILGNKPDYVIDAIDSINPKTILLQYCYENKIPVISCMGAATKTDPSMLRIDDLSKTCICQLAKDIRKGLRKRGIETGIKTVFSLEPAAVKSLPPDLSELTVKRGRIRNKLPSMGFMPGIFGYAAAGEVILDIAEFNP